MKEEWRNDKVMTDKVISCFQYYVCFASLRE